MLTDIVYHNAFRATRYQWHVLLPSISIESKGEEQKSSELREKKKKYVNKMHVRIHTYTHEYIQRRDREISTSRIFNFILVDYEHDDYH